MLLIVQISNMKFLLYQFKLNKIFFLLKYIIFEKRNIHNNIEFSKNGLFYFVYYNYQNDIKTSFLLTYFKYLSIKISFYDNFKLYLKIFMTLYICDRVSP